MANHTYKVQADVGCITATDGVPGDACYSAGNDTLELGQSIVYDSNGNSTVSGRHTTLSKFIVAHEFGHNIQYTTLGNLKFTYDCVDDNHPSDCQTQSTPGIPECRCDFVTGGNRTHCLQSRQLQPFAEQEGFAHFYAANLMNNPGGSTCVFVYYKDILNIGFKYEVGHSPPNPVSCFYSPSLTPQQWMKNWCGSGITQRGNEWDWMTFLWELHNKGDAYTMQELQYLWSWACSGNKFTSCATNRVFYDEVGGLLGDGQGKLVDAAQTIITPSGRRAYFSNTGTRHAINTQ